MCLILTASATRQASETVPELFEKAEDIDVASVVSALFANACKYTRETLASSGILGIYEELEMQYATQFGARCTPAAQRR